MKFVKVKVLLLAALVLAPLLGQAQVQRLQLNVNSQTQGRHVIGLKQLINQQHPGVRIQNFQIMNVQVQAKSAHGQGRMALTVGGQATPAQTVPGQPRNYQSNLPGTFTILQFTPPARANQAGAWQLDLQGQIRVNRVIVSVIPNRVVPPRTLQTSDAGSVRFQKVIETTETLRLNKNMIKTLRFEAQRNMVEVIEVRAYLQNGREIFLDGLTGFYANGSSRRIEFNALNGEAIRTLVIRGVSPNLFNSRGEIHVQVGSYD